MPGGGSWTAPVIERAELLDHRGDGRRLRIPRGIPETAVEVAIVRLERAIDDRSGLDVLDPDVPAGGRRRGRARPPPPPAGGPPDKLARAPNPESRPYRCH